MGECMNCIQYRTRLERAEAEVARWMGMAQKTMTYCAYCGAEFPVDGDGSLVAEHIAKCEKHPMRRVESEVKRLREALEQVVQQDPKDYESDCEYWEWDNRGDIYRYGLHTALHDAAAFARLALSPSPAADKCECEKPVLGTNTDTCAVCGKPAGEASHA